MAQWHAWLEVAGLGYIVHLAWSALGDSVTASPGTPTVGMADVQIQDDDYDRRRRLRGRAEREEEEADAHLHEFMWGDDD